MESIIQDLERKDGVRMTWNVLPIQKTDYSSQPVPLALLYSPRQDCLLLPNEPVFCTNPNCRAVLNPYNSINFHTRDWECVFCKRRNILPAHFKDISSENLPLELLDENTTVEYVMGREANYFPIFIIVLDICYFDDERQKLALDAVIATLNNLPKDSLISLITFGTNVELYDLTSRKIRRTYLFSGKKEYKKEHLSKLIGKGKEGAAAGKFFIKKEECIEYIYEILNENRKDPFPVLKGYRQVRCTGAALSLAYSIIPANFSEAPAKILLFTQGPCTLGPGTIASLSLSDNLRSYNDILRGKSKYSGAASDFYQRLATEISNSNCSVDILASTLYDVGIYEMRPLADKTGGMIIMAQDFSHEIYISSCKKNTNSTNNIMDVGFNSKIKFITSSSLGYKGCISQGIEHQGGWKLNSLHKTHNITAFFEVKEAKNDDTGYFQIITTYQRSDKSMVTRVTTLVRLFSNNKTNILSGFDQEAAIVTQARMFTSKKEPEEEIDLIRRIDKLLVRFLKMYSTFQPDVPSSVIIPTSVAYFANFVFFLRRSILVLIETISPDESSYHRNLLLRESVLDSMTMIKPPLISFHYQGNTEPVELDSKSLNPDCILLLDTFHNVLIWRGKHIANWMKERLHEKEEYKFLGEMMESVKENAEYIVKNRLPTPHFTICDEGSSQERILVARVNPSLRNVVLTEDIDFDGFYECLCKLVVSTG